jgi:hypothetical protein
MIIDLPKGLIILIGYKKLEFLIIDIEKNILSSKTIDSVSFMASFVDVLEELRAKANLINIQDFSFLGIYRGPSPLNTTRAVLSMIKALIISFKIPCISFGGPSFYRDVNDDSVVLLEAFGGYVYYQESANDLEVRIFLEDAIKKSKNKVVIVDPLLNKKIIDKCNQIIVKDLPDQMKCIDYCVSAFLAEKFDTVTEVIPHSESSILKKLN